MTLKNDISLSGFLTFKIFATPAQDFEQIAPDQNRKFSSLVVYEPEEGNESLKSFLDNILSAAKLDLSKDVCQVGLTTKNSFSFIKLKANVPVEKVILFGVPAKNLGINLDLKLYTPMAFQSCTFLLADKLSVIQADVNKKRQLWACLQEIYLP